MMDNQTANDVTEAGTFSVLFFDCAKPADKRVLESAIMRESMIYRILDAPNDDEDFRSEMFYICNAKFKDGSQIWFGPYNSQSKEWHWWTD